MFRKYYRLLHPQISLPLKNKQTIYHTLRIQLDLCIILKKSRWLTVREKCAFVNEHREKIDFSVFVLSWSAYFSGCGVIFALSLAPIYHLPNSFYRAAWRTRCLKSKLIRSNTESAHYRGNKCNYATPQNVTNQP